MRAVSILSVHLLAATTASAVRPGHRLPLPDAEAVNLPEVRSLVECVGGQAGEYACQNVSLFAHVPLSAMDCGSGNDIWGWTDSLDGTEYALMGCNNGTAFVDLSDPESPIYLGKLPTHTSNSSWRDIKVYADHAFVVSEAGGHGLQVFDLTQLRDVADPPVVFAETAHLDSFGNAHNVAINEDSGYAYVVGSFAQCNAGLYMVDIHDPANPQTAGCFSDDGYTHDDQCVIYHGPDTEHTGSEICFASNEDTLTVVDVTDKGAPVMLARATYSGVGYTHQGWLTEDHRFFLLDDELDEGNFGHNTRTRVWDVTDLESPEIIGTHDAATPSRDHNQYVKGSYVYQSNYTAGLRILDLSQVAEGTLTEAGYFDIYPANDNPAFSGAWSNYPYFDSGNVIVSGVGEGLFVLRPTLPDIEPSFTVSDTAVEEGDTGVVEIAFPVSLSATEDGTVTVDYETEDDTAVAGVDYVATSGTLEVEPGQISTAISVQILPNSQIQENRTFLLHLSNPVGATVARGTATGTIVDDDDSVPGVTVSDPMVQEGDGDTVDLGFRGSLSYATDEAVSFEYVTVDSTAVAGEDYMPVSGTATIEPGHSQVRIDVPVIGNDLPQDDRMLLLQISDSVNATIDDDTGEGTILDDDAIEHDGLDPSSGAAAGGETILVTGRNFLTGVEIEFAETPATEVEILSETELLATTPALDAGELFDVHVFHEDHHDFAPAPQRSHPQHKRLLADFLDVPRGHLFHDFVEILRRAAVTGGCGGGRFCVADSVNRAQMSVFLLKGFFGGSYEPPACTGLFDDVPCPSAFADWIEDLYNRGITSGCGASPKRFCPAAAVTRGQMAVFLLKTLEGTGYAPPPCGGLFEDVLCSSAFAGWIEDLVSREITAGCSAEPALYCPANSVTRGQMATFLVKTFSIPFLW